MELTKLKYLINLKKYDMFWKRKNVTSSINGLPFVIPPIPPKKGYGDMLELLREAESHSDKQIEIGHLDLLIEAIERYKINIKKTNHEKSTE